MFTYKTRVRMEHTDAVGIVFFASLFHMTHECCEAFLESRGFTMAKLLHTVPMPVVHAEADYEIPMRLSDLIFIELSVERLGNSSVTLQYLLKGGEGQTHAKAKVVHVAADLKTGSSIPIPDSIRELFGD